VEGHPKGTNTDGNPSHETIEGLPMVQPRSTKRTKGGGKGVNPIGRREGKQQIVSEIWGHEGV